MSPSLDRAPWQHHAAAQALAGGGGVALTLTLFRFACGLRIGNLNLRAGRSSLDVLTGGLLAALFLGVLVVQQFVQGRLRLGTGAPRPDELITLFRGVASDPALRAIWPGPVVWLGVAGFEEIMRVFMPNRLWSVWSMIIAHALYDSFQVIQIAQESRQT